MKHPDSVEPATDQTEAKKSRDMALEEGYVYVEIVWPDYGHEWYLISADPRGYVHLQEFTKGMEDDENFSVGMLLPTEDKIAYRRILAALFIAESVL